MDDLDLAALAELSDEETKVHAIFAASAEGDGEVSAPFRVLAAGDYVRGGRKIKVSEADLDKMVDNFKRWTSGGQDIPVDYDHSFAHGKGSRAAGWYAELYRKGADLFARMRWTEAARDAIRKREYRFFSPEFTANWQNEEGKAEGPTMLSGALTNRPFLRGKTAIAMQVELGDKAAELYADALHEVLAVNSVASDETRAEMDKPNGEKGKQGKDKPEETKVEGFEAPEGHVLMTSAEADELREKAGKVDELTEEAGKVEPLSQRVEKLEGDILDKDFKAWFAQANREGRLDAKDETREAWSETYKQIGEDKATKLLPPAETIPVSMSGVAGDGPTGEKAPEGTSPEGQALHKQVEKFAADNDCTYAEAVEKMTEQGVIA